MAWTLFTTVNKANGTDYDMAAREYQSREELILGIDAAITDAVWHCTQATTFPPSSIVFSVVLGGQP